MKLRQKSQTRILMAAGSNLDTNTLGMEVLESGGLAETLTRHQLARPSMSWQAKTRNQKESNYTPA